MSDCSLQRGGPACLLCGQPVAGGGPLKLLYREDGVLAYAHRYSCVVAPMAEDITGSPIVPSVGELPPSEVSEPLRTTRAPRPLKITQPVLRTEAPTHCDRCSRRLRRLATLLLCPSCDVVSRSTGRISMLAGPSGPTPTVEGPGSVSSRRRTKSRRSGRSSRSDQVYDAPVDSDLHRRVSNILNEKTDYL